MNGYKNNILALVFLNIILGVFLAAVNFGVSNAGTTGELSKELGTAAPSEAQLKQYLPKNDLYSDIKRLNEMLRGRQVKLVKGDPSQQKTSNLF